MPSGLRGGVETCWTEYGSGARDALLLHCSLAHHGAWQRVASALGDMFRFTAFDFPGHGQSAHWDGAQDYHATATAVARDFLREVPIDLIGHSFGATVALRLALENPGKVRSLVLVEPVLFCAARDSAPYAGLLADSERLAVCLEQGDADGAARRFFDEWGTGQEWAEQPLAKRAYASQRMHLIEASSPALYHDTAGLLQAGKLEQLAIPVLLLEGALSPPIIGIILDRLAERLPNARRASVPGARHMLPVTHSNETAAEIRGFYTAGMSARNEV